MLASVTLGSGSPVDIESIRRTTDVRKILTPSSDAQEFGRYRKDHCINPDHADTKTSMLVFADGVYCMACGYRADAFDIYRAKAGRPLSFIQAAQELESGEWKLDPNEQVEVKLIELDQSLAARYHIELAKNELALARLEGFGFTRDTIRRWLLGYAYVSVRTGDDEEGKGVYEHQWRYSVPVYQRGRLVQIIYRKSDDEQLGGKITVEKNAGSWLFNRDGLVGETTAVVCEGWGDVLALRQNGYTGVCSTNGAGHWNSEWEEDISAVRRLYVVGDLDRAGFKLVERVQRRVPWARAVHLPDTLGAKGDIRDFFNSGASGSDFRRLLKDADARAAVKVFRGKV